MGKNIQQALNTSYERGNKVNCFSSSNLDMNFWCEWWISILNTVYTENVQFNVKFHNFHFKC